MFDRTGDPLTGASHGRYLAAHIPEASDGEESDRLVAEIQQFLTGLREAAEPDRVLTTVLFTDIVASAELATAVGDREWRDFLERYYAVTRRQLDRFRGREMDTAGDGVFASFDGPTRAIRCACAIAAAVRQLGVEVRAGLHTGECEVVGGKVAGIAVHIGARVAAMAKRGEVLVSRTVKDLVAGSGIRFEDRGGHVLKGIPGEWHLFAVDRLQFGRILVADHADHFQNEIT